MTKKITTADAEAVVKTANGADPAAAAAARDKLVRWAKDGAPFDSDATRRWVEHVVMIYDLA